MAEISQTFEEPKGNPLLRYALIAVALLLVLGIAWYIWQSASGVRAVQVEEQPPVISELLPPPPPPPPPPPKPQDTPPEPVDKPTPAPTPSPTPDKPAPAPMQMNAEAQAGASSGIAAGTGGGIGAPGGTGTCVGTNCFGGGPVGGISDGFYARNLSNALQRRVERDRQLSRMVFTADFAIWVSPAGAVTRADLVRSSGDSKRDAMLKTIIENASGLDAPPASFKFPRRITVKGQRAI